MFDFGFGELLLLGVIALVVLGPERLPVAARLAGRWIRKAREQWNSVKAELENELADEELRRELRETADAMRAGSQQVRDLHDSIAAGGQQMTRLAPSGAAAASPAVAPSAPADAPGEKTDPGSALPGTPATSPMGQSREPPDAHG